MMILLQLIVFLPLISAMFSGFAALSGRVHLPIIKFTSAAAITLAAIFSIYIFARAALKQEVLKVILANWFFIGDMSVDWAIYVDQLTSIMFVLVTSVSAVVHIYSLGYMKNDKNLPKFLAYLSLFTFFMLVLVCSDNFIQLFMGWEGVGLCSYLLIGYYYHKSSANHAAIKAFIVNRVSDFAFILGIIMVIIYTNSVDFERVFSFANILSQQLFVVGKYHISLHDVTCLLIFIGCMGKSAQIGLHVWLPDAMEGPTPVSALIHAATMVTAGVFLVVRCSFMFEYSPLVLDFIAIIGATTCIFAALVAVTQTDIKKIIAYSTCSQLGYMFFACGVSAYQAAMFHLVTHGFFKALLFLSAGNVIYATKEQDLFKLGNLASKLPVTYGYFWAGSLAIIGIYPFAGFYSKDAILVDAYMSGGIGYYAFICGAAAALMTAIYSTKILILSFHGQKDKTYSDIQPVPSMMNGSLVILLVGTLFSGMFGYYILDILNTHGLFAGTIYQIAHKAHDHPPLMIEMLALILGLLGILLGYIAYSSSLHQFVARIFRYIYYPLKQKLFFDEIYHVILVKPVGYFAQFAKFLDEEVIDRIGPRNSGCAARICSWCICRIQTGYINNYALYVVLAILAYITFIIMKYLTII